MQVRFDMGLSGWSVSDEIPNRCDPECKSDNRQNKNGRERVGEQFSFHGIRIYFVSFALRNFSGPLDTDDTLGVSLIRRQ